mgnify:FL=1
MAKQVALPTSQEKLLITALYRHAEAIDAWSALVAQLATYRPTTWRVSNEPREYRKWLVCLQSINLLGPRMLRYPTKPDTTMIDALHRCLLPYPQREMTLDTERERWGTEFDAAIGYTPELKAQVRDVAEALQAQRNAAAFKSAFPNTPKSVSLKKAGDPYEYLYLTAWDLRPGDQFADGGGSFTRTVVAPPDNRQDGLLKTPDGVYIEWMPGLYNMARSTGVMQEIYESVVFVVRRPRAGYTLTAEDKAQIAVGQYEAKVSWDDEERGKR